MFRRPEKRPRLAMVTCVRNEERLLPVHLAYHRAAGVECAYVFIDRCTDGTERLLASYPWVQPIFVNPEDADRFAYVGDLQRLCMDRALEMARADGMDWLLMLDVDEFAVAENRPSRFWKRRSALERCDLPTMLSRVSPAIEVIHLAVSELLTEDTGPEIPHWRQQHFLKQPGFQRHALDPTDGERKHWKGNVGHDYGKRIVRTSANVQAFDPHAWVHNQNKAYPLEPAYLLPSQKTVGHLLHYVITDYRQWRDKYRKLGHEPAVWRSGHPVRFPKQCWKEAACQMPDAEARQYYRHWVAHAPEQLARWVRQGVARRDDIVARVLEESGSLDGNQILIPKTKKTFERQEFSMPLSYWTDPSEMGAVSSEYGLRFRLENICRENIRGLRPWVEDGHGCVLWVKPTAGIRVKIQPGDYAMTLRALPKRPFRKTIAVSIDERLLTSRPVQFTPQQISLPLFSSDFAPGEMHTIALHYPVGSPTKNWLKQKETAALTELLFERPVACRAAA